VTASFRGKGFIAVLPGPLFEGSLESAPPIVEQIQQVLGLHSFRSTDSSPFKVAYIVQK
jgi:hypothetical protein